MEFVGICAESYELAECADIFPHLCWGGHRRSGRKRGAHSLPIPAYSPIPKS